MSGEKNCWGAAEEGEGEGAEAAAAAEEEEAFVVVVSFVVVVVVAAAPGREAKAVVAGTASPPPPPLPSGVGEVIDVAPLLLLPAAPGFRRPMKEEVASGEVEVVVVISWERTRDAVVRAGEERERGRAGGEGEGSRLRAMKKNAAATATRTWKAKKTKRHAPAVFLLLCML